MEPFEKKKVLVLMLSHSLPDIGKEWPEEKIYIYLTKQIAMI